MRPRPYEVHDITPVLADHRRGKSFPSRHVFSAFVIAGSLVEISLPLGSFLMFLGSCLALIRVIGGVHYPKDVIAGAIIGLISACLGFRL